ncbi:uncharacterized protein LOC114316979 [Camellia sinensis]|uniref:uncharacterized protein LOC114316979 n=1 Tax=Camellia sinensis TaxID=4442 RepID=UPI001035974D|nr:uncharacterized protein LOC114316979 [Camellia sinensis]
MACSRNSRNSLCSIVVNGSMTEEPIEIKAEMKAHFLQHFSKSWKDKPKLSRHFKNIGGPHVVEHLEAEFTEKEISNVIKNCEAPLVWMSRPISLAGSLYKILAKMLSNRMKQVMPKIISEVQSAFQGGRNVLDGILIANEIVDGWKRSNKKGLIPIRVAKEIEKMQSAFLWGGPDLRGKVHLVRWHVIAKNKNLSGMSEINLDDAFWDELGAINLDEILAEHPTPPHLRIGEIQMT